jgi:hypothetical protein
MKKTAALSLLLAATTMLAPLGASARETSEIPGEEDDVTSLASPGYEGYRPAWANPYAEPEDLGINNDPTPFDPAEVDGGPSPLDPGEY